METANELDLFIGSKSSYEKLKREKNITVDDDDDESDVEEVKKPKRNKSILSKETLKPLNEDTMTILRRTRTVNDYNTVYMQSSLEFYDEFYNEENMSDELKAARQIRRVYKIYPDYLKAIQIRNRYIDSLIDKYGGEDEFNQKMSFGMIKDWIPREPILSKQCEDYDLYLSGMIINDCETLSEEAVEELMNSIEEYSKDIEIEESYDIEVNSGVIDEYEREFEGYGFTRSNTVTVNDLAELNKVFKSWYKPDGKTESGLELFKNAPENIRKRFYNYCSFNNPGLLARVLDGEDIEEELPDMNELVYDEVTHRNITRKEYMKRETIRLLGKSGWDENRLLAYSNVGSKLSRLNRKKKVGKKRKRPASEYDDDTLDSIGYDPMYSENEYLADSFLSLMRED